MYPKYSAALGSDLVLVPLPNMGLGTKSGQGSWAWAVGAHSTRKAAATSLLEWLTNDAGATAMANANGAVPGTRNALARSALVGPGKPLHLFGDQLSRACGTGPVTKDCVTVARPVTPAYPTVTAAFSTAVLLALRGTDPHKALSAAARTIDENLLANHEYSRPLSSS
ncbi:hypothetical protein [Pengzhenrongella sp.]|jgi:multiple sugar transport system substrate-binding protein|uniref:hypothetical protein n=1 Tax=Pengzhenrongella sp. TaxID=2888820 RepID=UPI0039C92EFF